MFFSYKVNKPAADKGPSFLTWSNLVRHSAPRAALRLPHGAKDSEGLSANSARYCLVVRRSYLGHVLEVLRQSRYQLLRRNYGQD